jgi:hypothetical protein
LCTALDKAVRRPPPACARPDELRNRLTAWTSQAVVDSDARLQWEIYLALACFTCGEGPANGGWQALNDRAQLAACWLHAGAVASRIIACNAPADSLIALLDSHRLISPRQLIENLHKFTGDRADPRQITLGRMMMFAAAPALLDVAASNSASAGETFATLLHDVKDDKPVPRMNVIQAELSQQNCLESYFAAEIGPGIDALHTGAAAISGNGLKALIRTLLSAESATPQQNAAWAYLRMASGESFLPEDLAAEARTKAASRNLADYSAGLLAARFLLHSVTTVAAVNGWAELAPAIDAAARALGPERGLGEEDGPLLFEIAVWRARLEVDSLARTKAMADELRRLGASPALRDQAERAALHFSRGLSGQETEAFVDVLAACRDR